MDKKPHYSNSLLKSALQKNVRKCRGKEAVKIARLLMENDFKELIRRLPVIIMEDSIVPPDLPDMTDLMIDADKDDFVITENHTRKVLEWVYRAAMSKYVDYPERGDWDLAEEEVEKEWSGTDDCHPIVKALLTRSKYGGVKSDMEAMRVFARLWQEKFDSDKEKWEGIINEVYSKEVDIDKIKGYPAESDILLESVDSHCTPVVSILNKKDEIDDIRKEIFGDDVSTEDAIDTAMWFLGGGRSCKVSVYDGKEISIERELIWGDGLTEIEAKEEADKIRLFHNRIKRDIDSVCDWILTKQRDGEWNK